MKRLYYLSSGKEGEWGFVFNEGHAPFDCMMKFKYWIIPVCYIFILDFFTWTIKSYKFKNTHWTIKIRSHDESHKEYL